MYHNGAESYYAARSLLGSLIFTFQRAMGTLVKQGTIR